MNGFKISTYIVSLFIFAIIVSSGVFMIGEFRKTDSNFGSGDNFEQFNSSFNKMDVLLAESDSLESSIVNAELDEGSFGTLNSLIKTSWSVLTLVPNAFIFMEDALSNGLQMLGLPAFISNAAFGIIIIFIIFAIIGLVLNRDA